jgi:hypothetical protein
MEKHRLEQEEQEREEMENRRDILEKQRLQEEEKLASTYSPSKKCMRSTITYFLFSLSNS